MTNSFLKALVLTVAACTAGSVAKAEELFSRGTIEAALNALTGGTQTAAPTDVPPAAAAPAPEAAPVAPAIAAPAPAMMAAPSKLALTQIREQLAAAGFEPQNDGEYIVVARVPFDQWKFPVAIMLSGDGERIHMALMLARYDQKQPTTEKLLSLLASNRAHQPAFFTFSEERKQMELNSSVPNDRPNIEILRTELDRMGTIAGKTVSLWDPNAVGANAPVDSMANSAVNPQGNPQVNGQGGASILGKWSAARSQSEAFALLLNQDASFTLVFVKDGKPTKSTGRFTLANGQLNLAADNGARLAGNFAMTSENTFELTPGSNPAAKLTFSRAR